MEEENWVVQINKKLKSIDSDPSASEMIQWKEHSIYKIPARIADLNKNAYSPQTVSFGPYHFGEKHLMPWEKHKHRALLHFLKRCGKPLDLLVHRMEEVVQDLMDSYNQLDPIWEQNSTRFLQLMILDGCFMLEIFQTAHRDSSDYPKNDAIFGKRGRVYAMPSIKVDMLLVENQLPLLVLDILIAFESGEIINQDKEYLNKIIVQFFSPIAPLFGSMGKCLHVLDVYRKSLFERGLSHPTTKSGARSIFDHNMFIRSAFELHNVGIKFKNNDTMSLKDFYFRDGVLSLPTIVVDVNSKSTLLNLIAFEQLHDGTGDEVTSYVLLMDALIDSEIDAQFLQKEGVLINCLGSHKAVVNLFNLLSNNIQVIPYSDQLYAVLRTVSRYCMKPWIRINIWRLDLIDTYVKHPWPFVSFVAGILLFIFTTVQTIYTIKQYYQQP